MAPSLPAKNQSALAITAKLWRSLSPDIYPLKLPSPLVRLNLHLRKEHINRLTHLATAISKRKGRDTRLAEALELALVSGLTWSDADMLDLLLPDTQAPYWRALAPIVRTRRGSA